MSLLEDLQGLDLSGIVSARGSISGSISSPQLQAILEGGAAKTALAGLGDSLDQVDGFADAGALLEPVLEAVHGLLGEFNLDDLPLSDYLDAVREGAETMARLFGGLDGEPVLARVLGNALSQLEERAGDLSDGTMRAIGGELAQFKSLIDTVDRGVPTDPATLAELALEALTPFPVVTLKQLRASVDGVTGSLGSIRLPTGRTTGLVAAFDAVTSAAVAVDADALARALGELELVRRTTLSTLQSELLRLRSKIDALPIESTLGVIGGVTDELERAGEGVLEYLERWRAEIAEARKLVEDVDVAVLVAAAPGVLDALEAAARRLITGEIDEQVEKLKEWLRSLLAHLPLRELRDQLSAFIHDAAQAVEDADLDGPAETVRGSIQSLTSAIAAPDLAGSVRGALEDAAEAISDALGTIEDAIDGIRDALEAIVGEATEVLGRAADALAQFKQAIDEVSGAVDGIGLEEAGQQVIDKIVELRETAQELLTSAPLPEPMRPLVEQLVDALEGLDIEGAVYEPIKKAAEVFELPDEVGATITAGLQKAKEALDNLIPAQLVESIGAEIDAALEQLTAFDPASLLGDVTSVIRDAASAIERLDPRELVAEIAAPFDDVLAAVDAAHPRRLLQPAIEAYRSLFDAIPTPPVHEGLQQGVAAMSSAGEAVGRAAVAPVLAAAPDGAQIAEQPAAAAPEIPDDLPKPGDLVRLFGYLPQKLREALAALEAGPVGEVLAEIDRFVGGLARDLRAFDAAVWELEQHLQDGIDQLLEPVAAAQLRAQLSIQTAFSARASAGGVRVDVDASMSLVAAAGAGSLRADLEQVAGQTRTMARQSAELASGAGALPRIAAALERSSLTAVADGADAFLAALDPEPIAAELDALLAAALAKAPAMLDAADDLRAVVDRIQALVRELNPAAQAQRYLSVLDVVREELELLDPGRLADELAEVHAAARAAIAAYDPRLLAEELGNAVRAAADQLRALDPAALLGDLSFMDGIKARIEAINPAAALEEVGAPLHDLGERIAELDPAALLAAVNDIGPKLAKAAEAVAEAIRRELVTLLEALKFARAEASVSVEASVST